MTGSTLSHLFLLTLLISLYFFDSMFISVEDCARTIRFSYNYSMSFTQSNLVIRKQAGDTFYTRSYRFKVKTCLNETSS